MAGRRKENGNSITNNDVHHKILIENQLNHINTNDYSMMFYQEERHTNMLL